MNRETEAGNLVAEFVQPWTTIAGHKSVVTDKRRRGEHWIESQTFSFSALCRDFERFDEGLVPRSNFIERVRLCPNSAYR